MSLLLLGLVMRSFCELLGNSCTTLDCLLSTERQISASFTTPGNELKPIQADHHKTLLEKARELLGEVLYEESGKSAHPAKTLWHPGLQI